MIPKVIHYCWFGGNPMPEEYKKYIESWKKFCPDYEIKRWDETNFDLNSCAFVKEAYEAKKWAYVSDYARLKIIYDEGGIYLDTDVELIRSLDEFLDEKCFLAEENSGFVATGLGFGAEKGNPVIGKMLEEYNGNFLLENGTYDTIPCPQKNTAPLLKLGYIYSGINIWKNESVTIFPPRYFCPYDYHNGETRISEDTVSIHHYSASWHSKMESYIFNINKYCNNRFGTNKGKIVSGIITVPFRIKHRIDSSSFWETMMYAMKKLLIK